MGLERAGRQENRKQGIGVGCSEVGELQTGTAGTEESWEMRNASAERTGQNQCREVGRWMGALFGAPELRIQGNPEQDVSGLYLCPWTPEF